MRCKPLGATAVTLAAALATLAIAPPAAAMSPDQRRAYRDHLLATLPDVPAFDDWIKRTDELPPDFDALPRHNALPDPLTFLDGRPVKAADDWAQRRQEILDLYQQYVWGKIPPHAGIASTDITDTPGTGEEGGAYTTRTVVIHCGPDGKATLHMTLIIPGGPGPFPVVMGPTIVGGFGNMAPTLLRRGYITASYAGSDFEDDSKAMAVLYPDTQDLGALPRRAWAASTALDYVLTLPQVQKNQVAEYGYSRDGKQATIAAALDPRFSALICGSAGIGGPLAFRNAGERNQAESIQSSSLMFPDWFHPRLRFFAGREDRLPVDGTYDDDDLLALCAPRPVLVVSPRYDRDANPADIRTAVDNAKKIYTLYHAADNLALQEPDDYNRLPPPVQDAAIAWMKTHMK